MTQQNNALNVASALAAQRMQQNTQEKTVLGGNLSAQAIQQQINNAADPGQSRLSVFNRMRAPYRPPPALAATRPCGQRLIRAKCPQ